MKLNLNSKPYSGATTNKALKKAYIGIRTVLINLNPEILDEKSVVIPVSNKETTEAILNMT